MTCILAAETMPNTHPGVGQKHTCARVLHGSVQGLHMLSCLHMQLSRSCRATAAKMARRDQRCWSRLKWDIVAISSGPYVATVGERHRHTCCLQCHTAVPSHFNPRCGAQSTICCLAHASGTSSVKLEANRAVAHDCAATQLSMSRPKRMTTGNLQTSRPSTKCPPLRSAEDAGLLAC